MPETDRVRLLLVDDHPIVRDGLKARLAAHDGLEVVGEASGGHEAIKKARELDPDVVFMDIGMPGMNGLEATKRLGRSSGRARVIILTVHDDREYVVQAVRSGAWGYILKNSPSADLVRAVAAVHQGKRLFPEEALSQASAAEKAGSEPSSQLTDRECEVLGYVAQGWTNKQIAESLFLSTRTIETHREHIMAKLGAHSVADLTRRAIELGLAHLDATR